MATAAAASIAKGPKEFVFAWEGKDKAGKTIRGELRAVSEAAVNATLRRHLKPTKMRMVIVTKDAEKFREALVSNQPSPIKYDSPKRQDILDEDKIIEKFPIPLKADRVKTAPVERIFQK